MSDRVTQVTCAQALDRYARMSGQTTRDYSTGAEQREGDLTVWSESGVKRLRAYVLSDGGTPTAVRDIGPGFSTWRELYDFLRGMIAAEELRASA